MQQAKNVTATVNGKNTNEQKVQMFQALDDLYHQMTSVTSMFDKLESTEAEELARVYETINKLHSKLASDVESIDTEEYENTPKYNCNDKAVVFKDGTGKIYKDGKFVPFS